MPTPRVFYLTLACMTLVMALPTAAATVNATWSAASDVPVTGSSYTATGSTVNFTLNFAPATGTNLTVVNNTGLPFINGTFDNLAQGQAVALSFGGVTYNYVAHYYGGTGNDLVLVWAVNRVFAWGLNRLGEVGDGTTTARSVMVPVTTNGVLAGKTITALANNEITGLALCSDGTLAAWGSNYYGSLGNYTYTDSQVPTLVNTTNSGSALYGKTVVAIADGGCNMALCSDGTVATWGDNSFGNIGDNTTITRYAPVAVNTASGVSALYGKTVVAIAAGSYHCMALCSDGTVAAWGRNNLGQLGNNTTTDSYVPVLVNTASGTSALYGKTVSAIAVGAYYSMALCTDGTVVTWGDGYYGQLGNNSITGSKVPVTVNTTNGVSALYGKTVVSVVAGYSHGMGLCSDGTVAAWGSNNFGQLGNNSTTQRNAPVLVNTASGTSALYGKTVVAITIGGNNYFSSRALCTDGTLATWGYNTYSLGNNNTTDSMVPVAVVTTPLAVGERVVDPASSSNTALTMALVAEPAPTLTTLAASTIGSTTVVLNGTVNPNGGGVAASFDYGITSAYSSNVAATPSIVSGGSAAAVSAVLTGLAPLTTYHFQVKGGGSYGGDQTFTTVSNNADLANVGLSSSTVNPAFTAGSTYCTASVSSDTSSIMVTPSVADPNATVTVNGTAVAAGSASGAINLTTGDNSITIFVTAQDGTTTKACTLIVARAFSDTLAAAYSSATDVPLSINGFSLSGSTVNFTLNYAPVTGTNLTVVNNTSVGFIHGTFDNLAQGQTVALSYGGVTYNYVATYYGGTGNDLVLVWSGQRLLAWGDNTYGKVGDGTTTQRSTMVPVTSTGALVGKTIIALADGFYHSMALCSDGTVAAWGSNSSGQLGNNTNTNSYVPVLVNTTSGVSALYGKTVVAIAAGYGNSMALCSDGTVSVWGGPSYVPVAVSTASGVSALYGKTVVAIAAGSQYFMALCSDGAVATWGSNDYGKLGNKGTADSSVPVLVNTASGVSALYGKTVVAVSAGREHSMALCSDGTVATWGSNLGYALGTSSYVTSNVPVPVNTASGVSALYGKTVTAITAGYDLSMALCADGTVTVWGNASHGQLGNGTTNSSYIPVAVSSASGVSALYGKAVVSIAIQGNTGTSLRALCADGTLACWGVGNGNLGNGGTADSNVPVAVLTTPLGSGEFVVNPTLTTNTAQSMVLVAEPAPTVMTLAATQISGTSAALNGAVNASNGSTLAFFDYGLTTAYGRHVAASPATVTGGADVAVTAAATGFTPHTTYHFRVTASRFSGGDQTFTTLNNDAGLSGLVSSAGALSPDLASGTFNYALPEVSTSTSSITLTPTTTDSNASVQINGVSAVSGSPTEVNLDYGTNLISVQVSAQDGVTEQTYILSVNRALPAIFSVNYSAAGDVPLTAVGATITGITLNFSLSYTPATGTNLMVLNNTGLPFINGTFANLAQGQSVALSYNGVTYHFVANYYGGTGNDLVLVWANNLAFAWGYNNDGEVGDNTTTSRNLPTAVVSSGILAGKTVLAVSEGINHALALCSDGTLAAWGANTYGQLGNNSTTQSSVPLAVNNVSGVSALYGKTIVAIAAGNSCSLVLCSDGTTAAWGYNVTGQLGDNTTTQRNVPVAVNTTSGVSALYGKSVVAVAAHGLHSLALCSDGTVVAWGYNFYGQLGDTTATQRNVPVAVNTTSGVSALYGKTVVDVAAGEYHSMVLCSDGTVAAWGYNGYGQLGDSTTTQRTVPVTVSTATGVSALYGKTVVDIATGQYHNTALCSDGTVAAWGYNSYGQLGDNTITSRYVPVAVKTASGVSALYGKTVVGLATNQSHSLVQCADGTLAAWGSNAYGELGDNTTVQRNVPVLVNISTLVAGQQLTTLPSNSGAYEWTLAVVAVPAYATVATQAAVGISGTNATLNGTVVAAYDSMAVSFDYGTTNAYGTNVAATPTPVSGGTATPVSAAITGLLPGTTYHYRVNGINSVGTLNGADLTFTTLSNNANLANLVPSSGTLTPVFDAGTLSYTTIVPYYMTTIKVTPTLADANAQVKVNGVAVSSGSASSSISLAEGSNSISIAVTAQDGVTIQTYTLTVTRAAGPILSGLGLSSGTLSPAFASSTTAYTATIPGTTSSITFTPAWDDNNATVKVNGQSVASGAASNPIAVSYGNNSTVSIAITAPDGLSTRTYTLTLVRPLAAAFSSGSDVPLTTNGLAASGGTVTFALNYMPAAGTNLTVVNNTGRGFISGTFANLSQGQAVTLTYNGITYNFVANYYGGTGNDLILMWANIRAFAWGSSSNGQIGDLLTTQRNLPVSVYAAGALAGKTIVSLAAGGAHTLALCSDGTVFAWGSNAFGQLGDNTTFDHSSAVAVNTASGTSSLFGKRVIAIAAGGSHSLALCSDGTVAAWGSGTLSQLGNGSNGSRVPLGVNNTPGSALYGKTVVAVAAGSSHNLALCSDGTMVAWGYNATGQLGINNTLSRSLPVAVNTASGVSILFGKTVVAIAAGGYHSLALCSDGTLAAWGNNASGQLGDNTSTNRLVPVAVNTTGGVSSLSGKAVLSMATGTGHSLALCSDGSVVAWGSNSSGQLGDNSTTNRLVPVTVNTANGVSALFGKTAVAVATGANHSLVQTADGTLAGWGLNSSGQIGDNTIVSESVPVVVNSSKLKSVENFSAVFSGSIAIDTLALAASPPVPSVSNPSATAITSSSVTLNGTMIANNNSSTATFEYGTTNAYGTTVSATDTPVTGTLPSFISRFVSGLTPGTTYHFRFNGMNAAGTSSTGNVTFTTLSTSADLTNFTLSSGPLNPAFDIGTVNYTTSVSSDTSFVTVTPIVAESHAALKVSGVAVTSGSASNPITLGFGDTAISTVVTAQDGSTTKTYTVTVTRPINAQSWRQQFFGTTTTTGLLADNADYDGDGIPNLMEFALNLSPTTRSTLPVATKVNGANFEYSYSRGSAAVTAGTTFTVEWSDTLAAGSWSSGGVTQVLLSDDGTTQQVKAVIPINTTLARFVRLSVTAPP
jgi:alpha-tubulin suppressor-like RCC1 family protein